MIRTSNAVRAAAKFERHLPKRSYEISELAKHKSPIPTVYKVRSSRSTCAWRGSCGG